MPSKKQLAGAIVAKMGAKFEKKKRVSRAIITSVQTDSSGRVIGAIGNVDGLEAQRLYVDHGSNLIVGDVLEVVNRGGAAAPAWYSLRRLNTTIPVPTLPFGVVLPTPLSLELEAGAQEPVPGSGYVGYINAQWRRIDAVYGTVSYQIECRRDGVDEDPRIITIPGTGGLSTLPVILNISATTVPYGAQVADYSFTDHGIIKIHKEWIYYGNMTRTGGCDFVYPYTLATGAFYLLDYVEDDFTDTDTTDIVDHTPGYDRYAGGWYAIPTYATNWAISSNQLVASPGGSWPYAAALIQANNDDWTNCRISARWKWPTTSGHYFGYIIDYVSSSDLTYVVVYQAAPTIQYLMIYETAKLIWSQQLPPGLFVSNNWYKIEVMALDKDVQVRFYNDQGDSIYLMQLAGVLSTSVASEVYGIYSTKAITIDTFRLDDARFKDLGAGDEWINFAYCVSGQGIRTVTDDGYNPTLHRYEFQLDLDPNYSGGSLQPTFYNCVRGYADTDAGAHAEGAGIYGITIGRTIGNLEPDVDYSVRVRAYKTEEVMSPWTDWHTVKTDPDPGEPTAPTSFDAIPTTGGVNFIWTPASDPDVIGFTIYMATDEDGTGATILCNVPTPLDGFFYPMEFGTEGYFNIKSYNAFGDLSSYTLATGYWVWGMAGTHGAGQVLTNADWEVGDTSTDTIQDWDYSETVFNPSYPATMDYKATGGWLNSKCIEFEDIDTLYNGLVQAQWPDPITVIKVPSIPGATYCLSVYVYSSGGTTYLDGLVKGILGSHDGSSNTNFPAYSSVAPKTGHVSLGNNWYRKWWLWPRDTTYPYLACRFNVHEIGVFIAGTFRLDRPMLEVGTAMTEWELYQMVAGTDPGLRLDTTAIIGDNFTLDNEGSVASDLLPDADDTRDQGSPTKQWKDVYISGRVQGLYMAYQHVIGAFLSIPLGLRAFYPMGPFARDLSGYGNEMTYVGGDWRYASGCAVPHYRCNGTSGQYLYCATTMAHEITGTENPVVSYNRGMTIGGWYKPERITNAEALFNKWGASGNYSYSLSTQGATAGDPIAFTISNTGTAFDTVYSTSGFSANTWYWMVGRYAPGDTDEELAVMIDDEITKDSCSYTSIYNSTASLNIGASVSGSNPFLGGIALQFLCASALDDNVLGLLYDISKDLFNI